MFADRDMRECIEEVLRSHEELLAIAVRKRAKFEGWLKLELAWLLESRAGVRRVTVEEPYGRRQRADIAFNADGVRYYVELKTANTNWRLSGVENRTRPITNNVSGIVTDITRLQKSGLQGFMGFVLFPIPVSDRRWHDWLHKITAETGVMLTEREHCSRLTLALGAGYRCEIVICSAAVGCGA